MKKRYILVGLLALSLSSLSSCTNTEKKDDPIVEKEDTTKRRIKLKEVKDVKQGMTINLNDYVEILPGDGETETSKKDLTYTYDILKDSVSLNIIEENVVIDASPSIEPKKQLALIRPGHVVIRINSKKASALLEFDVAASDALDMVSKYLDSNEINSYKVSKDFTFDENFSLTKVKGDGVLYKGENYIYYPSDRYGIALNEANGYGYYFFLNGVEGFDDSFSVSPNGVGEDLFTKTSFDASYVNFKDFFTTEKMEYNPILEELFGSEYAYGYPFLESTQEEYLKALNSIGLKYQHSINSSTFYSVYLIPKVNSENKLEIYSVSTSSSKGSLLEGPYTLDNVNTSSIEVVDNFIASTPYETLSNKALVYEKLNSLTNYTVKSKGQYEDLKGNKVDTPEYFSVLPTFDNLMKVTTTGLQSSIFNYIDGGEDEDVILLDQETGGEVTTHKYVKAGSGYTDKGPYGKDPEGGYDVEGRLKSRTFGQYVGTRVFSQSSLEWGTYFDLGNNTYRVSGLNDTSGWIAIKYLIGGTSSLNFVADSYPLAYFKTLSTLELSMGNTATDDIGMDAKIQLINLKDPSLVYVYHYTATISDIDKTVISVK